MAVNQAARMPTDAELTQINQYVPSGYARLTADEVGIVSVMVTNNLLTYNYQKWSVASLSVMPSLITGKQSTVNHDSWNVEKVLGKIFNATYTKSRNIPAAKLNSVNAYQSDINKAITAKEGYAEVTADIFYPRKVDTSFANEFEGDKEIVDDVRRSPQQKSDATIDVPELNSVNMRLDDLTNKVKMLTDAAIAENGNEDTVLQRIRFGLYDRVSLGSFDYTALRCPDCTCEKGFPDMHRPEDLCPLSFIPPMPEWGYEPNTEVGTWNGQLIKVAPYAVRDGLRNAEEISFVLAGNNPFAGVKRD